MIVTAWNPWAAYERERARFVAMWRAAVAFDPEERRRARNRRKALARKRRRK